MAAERERPDVARRRARWQRHQAGVDPRQLVFIDETWAKTNMAPLRGWAKRGARLPGKAPLSVPQALGHATQLLAMTAALIRQSPSLMSMILEMSMTALAFSQRRKMLRASLRPLGDDIEALLGAAGIAPTERPEQLPIEAFCRLAQVVAER